MGGDQYTQIHNYVFRDRRLTPVAMAVFGHVSTHSQGWATSAAGIARDMGIPESTVGKALRLLKTLHYMVYGQDRRPDGTVEEGWYFITDLPAQLIGGAKITDDAIIRDSVQAALAEWLQDHETGAVLTIGPRRLRAVGDGG